MAEQSNYSGSFPIADVPLYIKHEPFDDDCCQLPVMSECELSQHCGRSRNCIGMT